MNPANHRPDYGRDFSRNRDSIMIGLISLLKVSCKSIISISMDSLYRITENGKGRKQSYTCIHYKSSPKTYLLKVYVRSSKRGKRARACVRACVGSRMNEVSQVKKFLFSKIQFLVRDDKHVIVQVLA